MAIDQATLIQMVYDSVFAQFIKPATIEKVKSREVLLSLEFPGQQIDESQYQNPWSPQNNSGSQFATEMFSALIDAIPLVDSIYVDSGVTIEEMYQFVVGSVTANLLPPSPNGEVPPNPVNTTLNNARQVFEQTSLASALNPVLSYHPSYATPGNWADPAAAQEWTSVSINSNTTTVMQDSPFLGTKGAKRIQDGIWKVPLKLQSDHLSTVNPFSETLDVIEPIKQILIDPDLINSVRPMNTSALMSAPIEKILSVEKAVELQQVSPSPLLMNRINHDWIRKIQLQTLATQAIDQSTKDVQISFRCCRVNFNRPWLLKSILEITGWTLPGQSPGSLSNGTLQDNGGIFPLLPISFIAIRDLKIQANWGEADRKIADQAIASDNPIGFGPFALSGRYAESGKGYKSSFDGVTITSPGLQILGWINLVIPYTPPGDNFQM